jgi:replicative superfamily II helicase
MSAWRDVFVETYGDDREPYGEFQVAPAQMLLENGRNVILQAPTGSGKTITAQFPFLAARLKGYPFPSKMIYSVPMRGSRTCLTENRDL